MNIDIIFKQYILSNRNMHSQVTHFDRAFFELNAPKPVQEWYKSLNNEESTNGLTALTLDFERNSIQFYDNDINEELKKQFQILKSLPQKKEKLIEILQKNYSATVFNLLSKYYKQSLLTCGIEDQILYSFHEKYIIDMSENDIVPVLHIEDDKISLNTRISIPLMRPHPTTGGSQNDKISIPVSINLLGDGTFQIKLVVSQERNSWELITCSSKNQLINLAFYKAKFSENEIELLEKFATIKKDLARILIIDEYRSKELQKEFDFIITKLSTYIKDNIHKVQDINPENTEILNLTNSLYKNIQVCIKTFDEIEAEIKQLLQVCVNTLEPMNVSEESKKLQQNIEKLFENLKRQILIKIYEDLQKDKKNSYQNYPEYQRLLQVSELFRNGQNWLNNNSETVCSLRNAFEQENQLNTALQTFAEAYVSRKQDSMPYIKVANAAKQSYTDDLTVTFQLQKDLFAQKKSIPAGSTSKIKYPLEQLKQLTLTTEKFIDHAIHLKPKPESHRFLEKEAQVEKIINARLAEHEAIAKKSSSGWAKFGKVIAAFLAVAAKTFAGAIAGFVVGGLVSGGAGAIPGAIIGAIAGASIGAVAVNAFAFYENNKEKKEKKLNKSVIERGRDLLKQPNKIQQRPQLEIECKA